MRENLGGPLRRWNHSSRGPERGTQMGAPVVLPLPPLRVALRNRPTARPLTRLE